MKIAPLERACRLHKVDCDVLFTNQHKDEEMSSAIMRELGVRAKYIPAGTDPESYGERAGRILDSVYSHIGGKDCLYEYVVVVGDVDATLWSAIAARRCETQLVHVEAGLRSFDMDMPEEVNRMLVDRISDIHFCTEPSAVKNLEKEGITNSAVLAGNVMADNLFQQIITLPYYTPCDAVDAILRDPTPFAFATIHRPVNVDEPLNLIRTFTALKFVSRRVRVVLALHPRMLYQVKCWQVDMPGSIMYVPPLKFQDALKLWSSARFVITDSGGLQEETSMLGIPCLTMRNSTERPITLDYGTSRLVGSNIELLLDYVEEIMSGPPATVCFREIPGIWDGQAAERIIKSLL